MIPWEIKFIYKIRLDLLQKHRSWNSCPTSKRWKRCIFQLTSWIKDASCSSSSPNARCSEKWGITGLRDWTMHIWPLIDPILVFLFQRKIERAIKSNTFLAHDSIISPPPLALIASAPSHPSQTTGAFEQNGNCVCCPDVLLPVGFESSQHLITLTSVT